MKYTQGAFSNVGEKDWEVEARNWIAEVVADSAHLTDKEELTSRIDRLKRLHQFLLDNRVLFVDNSPERLLVEKKAELLANCLDNPALSANETPQEATGFLEPTDVIDIGRRSLERGQKTAIEAGLSGVDLGNDFRKALNETWLEAHPFVVRKEK